jgi:hypothetical protein
MDSKQLGGYSSGGRADSMGKKWQKMQLTFGTRSKVPEILEKNTIGKSLRKGQFSH